MGCCSSSQPNADEFLGVFAAPPVEYSRSGLVSTKRLVLKQKVIDWNDRGATTPPFAVKDETGKPYCIVVPGNVRRSINDPFRVVIKDTDGNPIALISFRKGGGSIDGFRPLFAAQLPISEKQDGMPLYAWAKIARGGETWLRVAMANPNGSHGASAPIPGTNTGFYMVPNTKYKYQASITSDSKHARVFKANLGCCLMDRSIVRVEASPGIYVREHVYDVTIAPGIDPVLMIGLTIFIPPGSDAPPGA